VITKLVLGMLIAMAGNGAEQEIEQLSHENELIGTFKATHYTAECDGCSGITYTGYDVRRTIFKDDLRIIAVDPEVIPLRTVVKVEFSDGSSFRAVALDIGGAIKGNRIDILVSDKATAYQLGVKRVRVYKE